MPQTPGGRTVALVQSRMTSSRLPGKNLKPIQGRPMVSRLIGRLKDAGSLDAIVLATSTDSSDDPLERQARTDGVDCHRGSLDNVLVRMVGAAEAARADRLVLITGDCPLVDPGIVDACVARHAKGDVDYVYDVLDRITFPIGFDVQVFSTQALQDVAARAIEPIDRTNVTSYFYKTPDRYRLVNLYAPPELDRPRYRLTVDHPYDFELVTQLFGALDRPGRSFSAREICAHIDAHPELVAGAVHGANAFEHPRSGGRALQERMDV